MAVYERKFGGKADLVLANPIDMFGKTLDCVGFEVRVSTDVQPGTIWVGKAQSDTSGQNTSGQDRFSQDIKHVEE